MNNKDNIVVFDRDMLEPIENYKMDKKLIVLIDNISNSIMVTKDEDYGGSWQADGLLSVHLNTKRKFDRVHKLFMSGFTNSVLDETVLDTLIDLRNYATLYISFLVRKDSNKMAALNDMKFVVDALNDKKT